MFKTLRARLILNALTPILIILPVMVILTTYLLETQIFMANLTNELTRQAILVADTAATYTEIWQDPVRAQAFVERISPNLTAELMLLDPSGRLIVSSDPGDSFLVGQVLDIPDAQLLMTQEMPAEVNINHRQITDISVPVFNTNAQLIGFVRLTNPLSNIYQRSEDLRRLMLFVLLGGLLIGVLFSWILGRQVEKPLRETTQAAYRLASGDHPTPLPESGTQETRMLQNAFNTLLERLQTLESSRKRLLANLVHELGRPLGALRSASQALLAGAVKDPQLSQELLQGMDDELVRLQGLLNEVSHLHEQLLGNLDLKLQDVSLAPWLQALLPTWQRLASDKKITWETQIADDLPQTVYFDPDRMAQVVSNLISNAIRYTPTNGKISVTLSRNEQELLISVADSGPGIQPEEARQVFEPFQRGQAARRLPEGMGLGLSIARDLVQAHGGRLYLAESKHPGATLIVSLPLQKNNNQEIS
jgi:signal transduction histidine kinase